MTYDPLCRGLLSGKLQEDAHFGGDDLRLTDLKFRPPRDAQYLAAVRRLDQFAQPRNGKRVIHLVVRWLLDQGATAALWGARHPGQLTPIEEVLAGLSTLLRRRKSITYGEDTVDAEFKATPPRVQAEALQAAQ